MYDSNNGQNLSSGVTLCNDGVYRWAYDLHLFKNPTILFTIWKIFGFIIPIIYLIDVLSSLKFSWFTLTSLWKTTQMFVLFYLGMMALSLIGYLVYAIIMGGKYCVLFEMNEKGIKHIQAPKQFEKAKLVGMITAMSGSATGNVGTMGTGLLVASKNSTSSDFQFVKSVICYPRRNIIKVNQPLAKNQIYCEDKDFSFVRDYIVSRCTKAKIKG